MSSKVFIRNIPTYGQHPNGCGLASLLMLLNIPEKKEIETFLNKGWQMIQPLFEGVVYQSQEYYWAIFLQYLLLKAEAYSDDDAKTELYEFFNERLEYSFEDQRIMNKFNQEQQRDLLLKQKKLDEAFTYLHYLEGHDYITPVILMKNLHTMKTDMELKILAEIFNYKFEYQEGEDMTGAIYFSREEIKKNPTKDSLRKWNLLEKWSNNPNAIILYGKYHHWLAIRAIYKNDQEDSKNENRNTSSKATTLETKENWQPKDLIMELNDPNIIKTVKQNFSHLNETDRFYIFQRRENKDYSFFNRILKLIEIDIPEEINRNKQYLDKKKKAENIPSENIVEKIKNVEKKGQESQKEKGNTLIQMLQDDEIIKNPKNKK